MRKYYVLLATAGLLALGACAKKQDKVAVSAPPPPPGAVAGSVAADRDGDGIVDGYYSSDGIYHPMTPPPAPRVAPAVMVTRAGERG